MAINVVCPGCLKRFQVSERFAGQKGPCPSCNTIIAIPKEQVKVHVPEEFSAGGKTVKGGQILKPIERVGGGFVWSHFLYASLIVLAVLIVAVLLGRIGISRTLLDGLGVIGTFGVAFPIAIYGYLTIRDREELFIWTGMDLYRRAAYCASAYGMLWIVLEMVLWYTSAGNDPYFRWFFIAVFVGFSILAVHVILDFDLMRGLLHYSIFFLAIVLLRGLLGLGWIWEVIVKAGAVPPPPVL